MLHEIAISLFIILLIISSIVLISQLGNKPTRRRAMWNHLIEVWTQKNISENNINIALQALRNLIMGNSGLISALLVILGIFVGFQDSLEAIPMFESLGLNLEVASFQFIIIAICDLTGVFGLILSTRSAITLSFLFSSDIKNNDDDQEIQVLLEKTFLSMNKFWIIGIRGLFFLVTAITWTVDPIFFICTTLIVFSYLIFIQDLAILKRD